MNIKIYNKVYNKSVISLTFAIILVSSVFVGAASGFIPGISANNADYVVLEGVAGNDHYSDMQYSYLINQWASEYENISGYPAKDPSNSWFNADKSLRIGMTEFGEFATPINAGLAYGEDASEFQDTETWASSQVNPAYWIQGWTFYMNYTRVGLPRAIEGYAIFSDTQAVEAGRKVYSWWGNYAPNHPNAQLTTGSLQASGVQVLYDSARLAVARSSTIITDGYYMEDVAKVTFTVILNKDTKYAIIFKDVKILLDTKILDNIIDFAFSERYEIDLARGVNPSNQAFVHWFEEYNNSTYMHPLTGDVEYDVVQAFNPARDYSFFAAYWPNTTEYSVYSPLVPDLPLGFTRVLPVGTEIADIPLPTAEPSTPWVIAQWRYNNVNYPRMLQFLAKDPNREIRFVEVAGMTDYNMGDQSYAPYRALDLNAGDISNNVDTEIRYLLDKVFNPEDLTTVGQGPVGVNPEDPPMWLAVGEGSVAADSAGAAMINEMYDDYWQNKPLAMFDKANRFAGTIPYGLNMFGGNYLESFSNLGAGTGVDSTMYSRTALMKFVFGDYDGVGDAPQPVSGGYSVDPIPDYWYPAKNPLTERWDGGLVNIVGYDGVDWNPNGIYTVGGPKANWLTRYFNDFYFAITREGTSTNALISGGSVSGTAPTSDPNVPTLDFFPLSTWATSQSGFGYGAGYAVISVARDINGTRGLSVYGWDARDTYWASAWASQYLGAFNNWIPSGTVAIVLNIEYNGATEEPTGFTVVKALGTITEFGDNRFASAFGYDLITGPVMWDGIVDPPTEPTGETDLIEWWFEKLPTDSIAKVDFDP